MFGKKGREEDRERTEEQERKGKGKANSLRELKI